MHAEALAAHGGSPGLRDRGLLESAVAAPQASSGGEPLMKDAIEVAAAYLFYLCSNRPLLDGNPRVGLASALVFLRANGRLPDPDLPGRDIDLWEALVRGVAASRIGREDATKRLRALLRRKRA